MDKVAERLSFWQDTWLSQAAMWRLCNCTDIIIEVAKQRVASLKHLKGKTHEDVRISEESAAFCKWLVHIYYLHGWTEHMVTGKWGCVSTVTVFLAWSWLISSYICSTVKGFRFCREISTHQWLKKLRSELISGHTIIHNCWKIYTIVKPGSLPDPVFTCLIIKTAGSHFINLYWNRYIYHGI